MTAKIRQDYKTDRNIKIYEEYVSTDTSFNKLGRKYKLSPQRVQFIVNDMKTKGLAKSLSINDKKEEREKAKDQAVELRESDKIELAISLFEQVIEWDKSNSNIRGQVDVCGHMSICYHLLAEKSKAKDKSLGYLKQGEKCLTEAIDLIKKNKLPEKQANITNTHLASNKLRAAYIETGQKRNNTLKEALKYINVALKNFPGSESARVWPLQTKAKIQHLLGDTENALKTLQDAEVLIYSGYQEEFKDKDQAKLKLNVWTASIDLTYAMIYKETGRNILAEHKIASVLGLNDPEKLLTQQKRKAKELAEEIN